MKSQCRLIIGFPCTTLFHTTRGHDCCPYAKSITQYSLVSSCTFYENLKNIRSKTMSDSKPTTEHETNHGGAGHANVIS